MPRAYLGITVPGFPNLFLLYGPNTNGGTGSVVTTIEAQITHVIAALAERDRAGARTIVVRPEAAAAFDAELRTALAGTVWHGLADMLGFLFLLVGLWWMVQAFLERAVNPLWWMTLISGILMTGLSCSTAGQLFATKAYTLLVIAGLWALMQGVVDIARSFEVRRVNKEL